MPTFIPPVDYSNPSILPGDHGPKRELFKWFGPYPRGLSVLRIGGVYMTIDTPDQLLLQQATEFYQGGRVYTIDATTAAALTAAGYGANII